jgi:hypothetical protein
MTYRGTIRKGVVILEGGASLPEGTHVVVATVDQPADKLSPRMRSPRLARPEQARDFRKQIVEVRGDAGL